MHLSLHCKLNHMLNGQGKETAEHSIDMKQFIIQLTSPTLYVV